MKKVLSIAGTGERLSLRRLRFSLTIAVPLLLAVLARIRYGGSRARSYLSFFPTHRIYIRRATGFLSRRTAWRSETFKRQLRRHATSGANAPKVSGVTVASIDFGRALASDDPVGALRAEVAEELRRGADRDEVYAVLRDALLRLRAEGRETDEDVVADVMDLVVGFGSPHALV
jgi:hypothetical protein